MMERYLRRLVVYCLILGTTFIFFLVIRHVSIEQGGKKTKLQETKVERRSKAKQPPKISESGKKGNELTSIGDATGVQRTFDVRKMCGKICDRTQQTCFPPELTIFIYGNVQSKYMMFEQNFRKWKSREEKFSSKRKFCPVNEIDSSFETLTMQKKCAIIGNSGILLKSKCGEEIDSHDYVLRANLAETDGYSEDVGNKTTLMMINVEMTTKIYNDTIFPDNGTVYDAILKNLRILNDSIIWYSKGVPAGSPYSKQLHDIATYVKRKGLNTRFAFSYMSAGAVAKKKYKFTGSYPSSGLIMLMVAETFCKEITLYGFYPYEKNPKGQPILHHYYDPRLVNFSTPIHNFDREYKFLQSLHEKGNLTLVVDPCRVKR